MEHEQQILAILSIQKPKFAELELASGFYNAYH
jgi:hypothetical protein